MKLPVYRIVGTRGRRTSRPSTSSARSPSWALAERGKGGSRRAGEQAAARRMLDALKASDRPGGPLRAEPQPRMDATGCAATATRSAAA